MLNPYRQNIRKHVFQQQDVFYQGPPSTKMVLFLW